jgi:hypothetical protein
MKRVLFFSIHFHLAAGCAPLNIDVHGGENVKGNKN